MKQIPLLLLLGFALSLCNLTNRTKKSGSTTSGDIDAIPEHAQLTAAQTAALAGGQTGSWDRQGISWSVPPKWTRISNDANNFTWHSSGGDAANLIVTVSAGMADNFPTEVSLKETYNGAKTRMKNGELDELRWLEIDGVKGVQFRESNPERPDGIRRMQWIAFRKFAGQTQQLNITLSSTGKGFPGRENEMYGVLFSMKVAHE